MIKSCSGLICFLFLLRLLITSFKVFGLAPFSTKIDIDNNNLEKNSFEIQFSFSLLGSIYNCLIIFIILSELICNYIFWPIDDYVFLHIYNLFKKIGLIIIILTFSSKQKSFLKIIKKLYAINNEFYQYEISKSLLRREKFYKIVTVIVYLTISVILFTGYILSELFYLKINSLILNINIVIEYISVFIIGWFIIQYSLLLIFIYHKLCMYNDFFTLYFTVENNSTNSQSIFLHEDIVDKFNSLRKLYQNIYNVLNKIAKFYSLPIFIAIVIIGPKLIISINTMIVCNADCTLTSWKVFNNSILIFLYFPIINLTVFVTKINEEIKCISNVLYKVITDVPGELNSELERFSVELLHWNVDFTAYGFFRLDNHLITWLKLLNISFFQYLTKVIAIYGFTESKYVK